MKKIFLLILISVLSYADIKVDLVEKQHVNYDNGTLSGNDYFRILCINGYQWLQAGSASSVTLSQMLVVSYGVVSGTAKPIKCENK